MNFKLNQTMTILRKNIIIPIDQIQNYEDYITNFFNDNIVGKIDKEIGYISSVKNIVKIQKNVISRIDNKIVFSVWVNVENIKPEVGSEYEEEILAISDNNILCKKDNIFLFVCIDEIQKAGYKYDNINNKFYKIYLKQVKVGKKIEKKKVKKILSIGSKLKLTIKSFELDKDSDVYKYICICSINL